MKRRVGIFLALATTCGFVACVGDQPSTGNENDASASDATSGDSGASDSAIADGGGDAATWTPASLPGLALWLDDESIDVSGGVDVAKWEDKSGKGNHAMPTTDGGGIAPLLVTSGIGGRQSVHFNGASSYLYIVDSASLRWGATGFALAAVERHDVSEASVGGGFIYAKLQPLTPNPGPALDLFTTFPPYSASVMGQVDSNDFTFDANDAGVAADASHLEIFRWVPDPTGTAGTMELTVDGIVSTKRLTTLPDITATGIDVAIGVNANSRTYWFGGDIATIIGVDGPTSDSDVASLTAYLKNRYGL